MTQDNTPQNDECDVTSFPGQQEGEVLEFMLGRHWIVVIPQLTVLLIICALIGLANYFWITIHPESLNSGTIFLVNSVIITIIYHFLFVHILNFYLRLLIVTNYRVIDMHCTTVLHRERKTLDLWAIQDIEIMQKGIIQRIFNYGTITLHNAGREEMFTFEYMPNPAKHYNMLNHIYRKVQAEKSRGAERQGLSASHRTSEIDEKL